MRPDQLSINRLESRTIDFARILCIFFMIWVHVYPAMREPSYVFSGPAHGLWLVVIDIFGRASVATLSFLSGYVLCIQSAQRDVRRIVADRFRSILLPMFTWNAIALLAVWLALTVPGHGGRTISGFFHAHSAWDWLSLLLAIDRQPANMPVGFLRDLFVSIVLLTLFRQAIARYGVLLLVLLAPLTALQATEPLLLRPSIALFALAGFVCASRGWSLSRLSAPIVALPAMLLFAAAYLLALQVDIPQPTLAEQIPNLAKRAGLVALMLLVASAAAGRWPSLPVAGWRTVLFVTFLSHGIVTEVLGKAYELSGGSVRSPAYLLFFFAAPFAFLAIGALLDRSIDILPGWAQTALRGTRRSRGLRLLPARDTRVA